MTNTDADDTDDDDDDDDDDDNEGAALPVCEGNFRRRELAQLADCKCRISAVTMASLSFGAGMIAAYANRWTFEFLQ